MEQITLQQIAVVLAFIAGLIGSISIIFKVIMNFLNFLKKNRQEKEINPILDEIKKINEKMDVMKEMMTATIEDYNTQINHNIDDIAISQCKDAIVDYVSGVKAGEDVSLKEERAYEAYDKYTNKYHQNSYIHKLWEEVVEKA